MCDLHLCDSLFVSCLLSLPCASCYTTQAALESIPTVGEVLVTRTELPDQYGYQWAVTFLNSEYYTGVTSSQLFNVPLMMLANTDNTPAAR